MKLFTTATDLPLARRVIVFTIYRLIALRTLRDSADPLLDRVSVVIWTQAELTYSLVTATLPSLTPLLLTLNTGLGGFALTTVIKQSQQDSQNYTGGSYEVRSTKRSNLSRSTDHVSAWVVHHACCLAITPPMTDFSLHQIRLGKAGHKSVIEGARADRLRLASDDSARLIINKRVDIDISSAQAHGPTY